ncbi:hypothetical protein Tco_0044398 [Tanacetum coccineum]
MSGKYGTSNAGAESVGVSDCNKVYKEADLLKHMSSEGFDDVGLRYVGGRWVWLEFDSMDQVESVKTSKTLKEIFLEFKDVSHDFIPDERCVWIRTWLGLPLASWTPEVYKKLGGRWGSSVFTDMVSDGPMSHGKVCVLTKSLHRVIESFRVSYRNRTYRIIATEFAYWAPNIESMEVNSESNPWKGRMQSDLVDSFEEGEIRDDSVLYNDGCIKDCMEKNLEDDVVRFLEFILRSLVLQWIVYMGPLTSDENRF